MKDQERQKRWDRRFLELAKMFGTWSKDRSAGTGCVIVGPDRLLRASGYNGFVRGIDDEILERHERPAKYSWAEHAERNAIYNAARLGIALDGCTVAPSRINSIPAPSNAATSFINEFDVAADRVLASFHALNGGQGQPGQFSKLALINSKQCSGSA